MTGQVIRNSFPIVFFCRKNPDGIDALAAEHFGVLTLPRLVIMLLLSSFLSVQAAADGAVLPVLPTAQGSVLTPDDYRLPADGEDDAPSIQRAIQSACGGRDRSLSFKARRYLINSPVSQSCLVHWKGQGFEEQAGTNYHAAGTWFDIGPFFVGRQSAPFSIVGGTGSIFELFGIAEPSQPPPPAASYDPRFPAGSATPRISSFTPQSWSPASFPYVFDITGAPGNLFRHIMLDGVTSGFRMDHAGRTNFEDIRGQVFNAMFDIHESYDVSRIRDVHDWPYWSAADPVMAYDQAHADVIRSYRNDTPFWDGIFGFGVHAVLYVSDDPDGTTTGLQAGSISCDNAVSCLQVDTKKPVQLTGQIATMRTFGARWTTIHPAPAMQYPGSSLLQLDSSAVLQIGSMENFGTDVATFAFTAPGAPSNVMVGSLFVHADAMGRDAMIAKFPVAAGTIPSLLQIATVPAIAGTAPGFRNSNTRPNGEGIGIFRYPAQTEIH